MEHNGIQTNYAVAPGEYIIEWLEENRIGQAEMAARMGISKGDLFNLIEGADLTDLLALKLETATGIRARTWLSYEALYRSDLARLNASETRGDEGGPL